MTASHYRSCLALVALLQLSCTATPEPASPGTLPAIIVAAKKGDAARVRALADASAVDAADGDGMTALMYASWAGNAGLVDELVTRRADVNRPSANGTTSLMWAVSAPAASVPLVQTLLAHRAAVNAMDHGLHATPIMFAGWSGNSKIVELLLEHGAQPNVADDEGITPLMYAMIGACDAASITGLLGRGADAKARGHSGYTPLMAVAGKSAPELVKLLVDNGTDVRARNQMGATALHAAAQAGNAAFAEALLEVGAEIDAANDAGWTPLMWAAFRGRLDVAKVLVRRGAKLDLRSADGKTALGLARQQKNDDVLEVLRAAGAPE